MLTRQNLPTIDRTKYAAADGIAKGAYVLADAARGHVPDVIIIASGSEVALALEAHERLVAEGVKSRVVNMASMRLFEQQNADYRESVLPPACSARLAVEAGVTFGWDRWVGDGGQVHRHRPLRRVRPGRHALQGVGLHRGQRVRARQGAGLTARRRGRADARPLRRRPTGPGAARAAPRPVSRTPPLPRSPGRLPRLILPAPPAG